MAEMVDVLKQETGITDAQLDCRIEEGKFWELAGHLGNHEQYVGVPGFGLNYADIADLKDCALRKGHQHAMTEAFKKWFNVAQNVVLTYRSLVLILLELRKKSVAEAVCRTAIRNKTRSSEVKPSNTGTSRSSMKRLSESAKFKVICGVVVLGLLAIGTGIIYNILFSEAANSDTALGTPNQNITCNSLDPYEVFPQQNLPHINSPFFGRTKELEELKQLVLTNSARLININGPPAFGKSRVANQLGHDLLEHSDVIPNIRYINTVTTDKSFFLCLFADKPSKTNITSSTRDIEVASPCDDNVYDNDFCTWMAWQKQRTVIIFDNCDPILHSEDRERFLNMLQMFLSMKDQLYNIVVVSQEHLFFLEDGFHSITLGALSAEESQTLLMHYVPKLTMEQADDISITVGGCPLALKVVAQLLKHGKRGGLNNIESFLANLKQNLTLQLSNIVSAEQEKLYRVIDIAYKRYLNTESRRCSRVLSLFPGPVREEMAKNVLSRMIDPSCIEDVINLSFIEDFSIDRIRTFSIHAVVHDYFKSVNRVNSDVKVFNTSFLSFYSNYLKSVMKQIYVYQNISDKDQYELNDLEYHNMCEFVRIFAYTEMDKELTVQTGTALGYLIQEKLMPNDSIQNALIKAFAIYAIRELFESVCAHSSEKICVNIYWELYSFARKYRGCEMYSLYLTSPKCSKVFNCQTFDFSLISIQEISPIKHGHLAVAFYYCTIWNSIVKVISLFYNWVPWQNKMILHSYYTICVIKKSLWVIVEPFLFPLWTGYSEFWQDNCVRLMDIANGSPVSSKNNTVEMPFENGRHYIVVLAVFFFSLAIFSIVKFDKLVNSTFISKVVLSIMLIFLIPHHMIVVFDNIHVMYMRTPKLRITVFTLVKCLLSLVIFDFIVLVCNCLIKTSYVDYIAVIIFWCFIPFVLWPQNTVSNDNNEIDSIHLPVYNFCKAVLKFLSTSIKNMFIGCGHLCIVIVLFLFSLFILVPLAHIIHSITDSPQQTSVL